MTCIAWDGKTLAADKRALFQGLSRTTTKIFRCGAVLAAVAGNAAEGLDMIDWVRRGRNPEDFPPMQRDEKAWAPCLVIEADGRAYLYERAPSKMLVEEPFTAMGSGRDFAITAMHLGKSAREAVEIACLFQADCGNGIDELTLNEDADIIAITGRK